MAVVETTSVMFPSPPYQSFIPQQYSFDGYPQVYFNNNFSMKFYSSINQIFLFLPNKMIIFDIRYP